MFRVNSKYLPKPSRRYHFKGFSAYGVWVARLCGCELVRMHMRTVNDIYINLKVSFNFEYVKFSAIPKHFSVAHLLINAVNATLLHIQLFKWWITWHGKVVKDYRRRDTIYFCHLFAPETKMYKCEWRKRTRNATKLECEQIKYGKIIIIIMSRWRWRRCREVVSATITSKRCGKL